MPLSSKKEVTKFVHSKLLFRFRRLLFFLILIIAIVIDEVSHNYIAAYIAAGGFVFGIALGLLAAKKMHSITWDAETSKAVTRMDRLGVIILVSYLIFSFSRRWIFGHWLQGYGLTAFSLSVGAGGMLGRLYSTRQKIRQVLKDEGVLRSRKLKI